MKQPANHMTVDVEDWFHILDAKAAPDRSQWDSLPLRLERNLNQMLELFARHDVRCTLFWLGWAAQRLPQLVRRCHELGHEVASHGQEHLLAYQAGPDRFRDDVRQAKQALEQITGAEVLGFRVPGFSFTEQTPWAYQVLAEQGYRYSSSIFPAARGHGGFVGAEPHRHTVQTDAGPVEEFPITTVELAGRRVCLFGGGYLRITPWPLLNLAASRVNARGEAVIYYLHPREVDPGQPKMWRLPPHRFFKYYINLHTTQPKLTRLLQRQRFETLAERLARVE